MVEWTPRDYQYETVQFGLEHPAAGLFLEPGLGKTSIMLAIFKILKEKGIVRRALVVAPLLVCKHVWPEEVRKWSNFHGLRVVVLHGKNKNKVARQDADIYLVNPEGLAAGGRTWYSDYAHKYVQPDMLVVDESTKFKNSGSKRFKSLKKLLPQFKRRYILSGTPMPNGYEDLFAQIYILDLGATLGSYITKFRQEHFRQIPRGVYSDWELYEGHGEIITDKISAFCKVLKADGLVQLPEITWVDNLVDLPDTARAHYARIENDFITMINEDVVTAETAPIVGMKLRQICNGGVYVEGGESVEIHKAKCEALRGIVEESGKPVLCAYQFKHDIDRIRDFFGYKVPSMSDSESLHNSYIKGFNDGKIPLLLAHTASVGHGLNLQESSNRVAFFGLPWSLDEYEQFIKRVVRSGNKHLRAFVHHIVVAGSVEQRMSATIREKDATQQSFLTAIMSYYKENENDQSSK